MVTSAISTEGISKTYRIGVDEGYQTLRDTLVRRLRHPLKRDQRPRIAALDDVSFEIAEGTATAIIGANGAGKSTLLKILARITRPSAGRAVVRGRVGALLEVGTGFHPELTGRENTYLSGAILGMSKRTIDSNLDQIVEFAGIGKLLDTPVKHYSSGMYVRLAFSVAAHLEPDILLVDEVLSVGDMAFQKKCLGRMDDVAESGRTVLFVSHNLPAITRLCDQAIWLDGGQVRAMGSSSTIVSDYVSASGDAYESTVDLAPMPTQPMRLRRVRVVDGNGEQASRLESAEPITVEIEYDVNEPVTGVHTIVFVHTTDGINLLGTGDADLSANRLETREPGRYRGQVTLPPFLLGEGVYSLNVSLSVPYGVVYDRHSELLTFRVYDNLSQRRQWQHSRRPGLLGLEFPWTVTRLSDQSNETHS